ncbi:hypothetical protein IFM89_028865 [Coptis chinensis]|uniref:Uncharacterized protein n=1 Tax=Coptis chinensis TaxID=261450 RepID=A0A835HC75_9MAGN|nr:hypothetical protein IFM89_028865 [Coptis chinensis]
MKSHLGRIPHMDIELCNVSPESVMQLARLAAQELGRKKGKTKGINEYMRASVDNSQVEKTSTKQLTLNAMLRKKEKEEADLEIARMVIANNLSFNLLRSLEFINAMEAVARHGPGYEQALRFMVASQEWRNLVRPVEGDTIVKLINSDVFWSDAKEMVTTVEPLIKVLRMADGEEATVGYLYEAMQRSKDSIATFYKNEESRYKVYWDIIDARLKKQLHNPLMAAADLLNPHLYFDKLVKHDDKTDKGVMEALKKMVPPEDHEAFSDQLADYIALQANIFTPFACSLLHKKHPFPNVPDIATTTATVPIPLDQGVVNIEDDDIDYAENDGDDVDLDYDDIQHDYAAPHFLFD